MPSQVGCVTVEVMCMFDMVKVSLTAHLSSDDELRSVTATT